MAVASNGPATLSGDLGRQLVRWSDWVAPPLVLCTPFVHFVRFNDYPVLRPEVLSILAGLLGLALVASLLLRVADQRMRVLIYALLVTAFLNLRGVHGFLVWLIGVGGLCWLLRAHLAEIVCTVFAVLLLTTLALPIGRPVEADDFERSAAGDPSLPPVIHLVLDEHIGVGGIPRDVPGGDRVARELRELYLRNGFRLEGGAYSQYFKTFDSLSNLLNFTSSDANLHYFPEGKEADSYLLRENAYFEMLARRGYAVRAYQSSYLNLCLSPAVSACLNYPKNSIRSVEPYALPWPQKAVLILNSYLTAASAERQARRSFRDLRAWLRGKGVELPLWTSSYRTGPLALADTWQRLRHDILEHPDGTVFFAHLLTPHTPYAMLDDCTIRPQVMDWLNRNSEEYHPPHQNSAETRTRRYAYYLQQVSCLAKQLQTLFDALREGGVLQRAIVIVHGDHGSRIGLYDPNAEVADKLSDRDLVDHYSTLFAIRAPDVAPGYQTRREPLQNLLARVWGLPPVVETADYVYLLREAHEPFQRRALDAFPLAPP